MDFFEQLASIEQSPDMRYSESFLNNIRIGCYNTDGRYSLRPETIIDLLGVLPSSHYDSVKEILYHPCIFNSVDRMITGGKYYVQEKTLLIGNVSTRERLKTTLYHEVGHLVHRRGHPHLDWGKWLEIFTRSNRWITEYAKTSVFEDFAESYMTFVLAPARLRAVSEAKYNIIAALFDGMADAAGQMADARGGWIV